MESVSSGIELAQLQDAIKVAVDAKELRPIIISLNGDNTWLWSFPRPSKEREETGKAFFHIVFEPWLNGPTGLPGPVGPWLVYLNLAAPPAAATAEDIDDIVRRIETTWAACNGRTFKQSESPIVDAILLGFHYSDHLHEPTLRLFDKRIPVVLTPQGQNTVQALNHFEHISLVHDMAPNASTWRSLQHSDGLPEWLSPIRLPGHHELNYLFALIWTRTSPDGQEEHQAIYQSPHGLRLDQKPLQAFLQSSPQPQPLALFHGLKESRAMGMVNTYGADGGLRLWRMLGEPKHWIVSHNLPLEYAGVVMRMLWVHDTPRTIEWALGREGSEAKGGAKTVPRVLHIGSGQASLL
ncbi:hypothetical protein LTR78_005278 [Recurvomyces mirabilis]|uniref:Uncharacterized protein n=1 Tax=Recurvomyces mirabilis TaxID=574656 RepID=A0AAE0WN87_9PEZI|nr:hypothetical protein LTR78_005278 [Recurvomyces mirabilis]KAK5157828.1 hypothetical protein LTS14_003750 [Recurvomyces mirabilis]